MASLHELLARRHRELIRALAETRRRLASIEEEIDQIERAATAANVNLATSEELAERQAPPTMKEAAVQVLREATGGLTTNELLEIINNKLGTTFARSSLSPQLSRLKGDGILYREEDGRWILASDPSLNENGASEDAPEHADRKRSQS
ncbi:HTH domain-containing protein [Mesorhizobium sp. M0954]|uniref:HTH domain-containing protein n=2 Tax=Mesorhizobium TaxID=68287 RepID=UPI003339C94E